MTPYLFVSQATFSACLALYASVRLKAHEKYDACDQEVPEVVSVGAYETIIVLEGQWDVHLIVHT